jgi:hypothetical protein
MLVFRSKNIALEKPELLNPPDPTLSLIFLTSLTVKITDEEDILRRTQIKGDHFEERKGKY